MDFEQSGEAHVDKSKDGKDYASAYYWSFEHSQGSPKAQKDLFKLMARSNYYEGSKLKDDEFLKNIPQRTPKGHETHGFAPESTDTQIEYGNLAGDMMDIFSDPYKSGETNSELVRKVLINDITKDLKFQSNERTGSSPVTREDPHASLLREYGLKGKSTGHQVFGEVYSELANKARTLEPYIGASVDQMNTLDPADQTLVVELSRLKNAWEEVHPGESFFVPPDEK